MFGANTIIGGKEIPISIDILYEYCRIYEEYRRKFSNVCDNGGRKFYSLTF